MRPRAPARRSRLHLELDAHGAVRGADAKSEKSELVRFEERFGVVLLVPPQGRIGQLVFTDPGRTRTVLVELDEPHRHVPSRLRRHHAGAPTGGQVLSAGDTRRLLEAVETRAPAAFERMYLSTSAGALVVEDGTLQLPDVTFDLRRALVHETYVFLEGPVLYRALAVRQAAMSSGETQERVFVVPLAEPVGADHERSRAARVPHRAAPRREQRVAVEQIFFGPLAAVLADAPQMSAENVATSDATTGALVTEADRSGASTAVSTESARRALES